LPHSYGYEAANELKSVLKLLDFRFGLYCRAASWVAAADPFLNKKDFDV
jgi:hypothetical protein